VNLVFYTFLSALSALPKLFPLPMLYKSPYTARSRGERHYRRRLFSACSSYFRVMHSCWLQTMTGAPKTLTLPQLQAEFVF